MLQVAKILKSNGTEGELLVGFRDYLPEDIDTKEPVFIYFDGLPVPFFIESLRKKGNDKALVRLTGILNLEDAQEITGEFIYAEESSLPEFEEDDSPAALVGWKVFDHGKAVGTVSGIEDIPGNPCIYVDVNGTEAMIPLHEDFVEKLDEKGRGLYLNLPEGLY